MMKVVEIDGKSYLMFENPDSGEFFIAPAIRLDIADEKLKSKAIDAYYKN